MYPYFKMTKPEAFECYSPIERAFAEWLEVWDWTWDKKSGCKVIQGVKSIQRGEQNLPPSPGPSSVQHGVSTNSTNCKPSPVISPCFESRQQVTFSPTTIAFSSYSSASSSAIASADSVTEPLIFINEFFEVRESPKGGYGAFALKDIDVDTIILSEKPLFKAHQISFYYEYEKLSREQRQEFGTLYGYRALSLDPKMAIFLTNRFATKGYQCGIFVKASRFNHACPGFQTCSYSYLESEDRLVITTCRHIKKGEEITIAYYLDPDNLYRNYDLYTNYGFWCDCPVCQILYE